jgi:hypothetical protein
MIDSGFFLDQEQKTPGNPETPEVFPAGKNIILAGDGYHSFTF